MANFSGAAQGYLNFDQAQQQKQLQQAQLRAYLQRLDQEKYQQAQQQALDARQKSAKMGAGADWMAQQLSPPPEQGQPPIQAPPPGQSSSGGTPNGGPPPQQQQQLPPPPPQGPGAQAMAMGPTGGGQIMPPPGAGAPPGAPPGPPQAAPPAAASPSWKPMPSAPPAGGAAPTTPGQVSPPPAADQMKTESGAVPFHNQELAAYAKSWKAQGLNGEQIMDRLKVLEPMMNSEQKQQLAQLKMQVQVQKETEKFQHDRINELLAGDRNETAKRAQESLDANRKSERAQTDERISIAKKRLGAQVASAAGGKANLKSVEYIYPKGADGKPDQSQAPIGTRGVTKSGKVIQMDIDGNTVAPGSLAGGTAKEAGAQAAKGQKSITNLKEDRRLLVAAGTSLTDPRVKALDDKISAMEAGGGGGAAKKKVGDVVPVNGKNYKVTGFDKDGEPLVVPAQ